MDRPKRHWLIDMLVIAIWVVICGADDVSPVREVSVVIGAWLGVRFMGEAGGMPRIFAAMLVAAGIIVIAVAG